MEGVDGSEKSILHGDGGLLSAVVGGGEDATVGPDSMGHAACAGATRVGGGSGALRHRVPPWLDARAPGPLAPVRGELGRGAASARG